MAEKVNNAFAFPSVGQGGWGSLQQVNVRCETLKIQGHGFKIGASDSLFRPPESVVNDAREDQFLRAALAREVRLRVDETRVVFTPTTKGLFRGDSFLLLAMLADHVAIARPDLFRDYGCTQQTDLAIVATGEPDKFGKLRLRESGLNVGDLEAKLKAVQNKGAEMFVGFAHRLLVVPDQKMTTAEGELLEMLKSSGWDVRQISSVTELFGKPPLVLADPHIRPQKPEEKPPRIRWQPIALPVGLVALLLAYNLRGDPPATQPNKGPALASAVLTYSGALDVVVDFLRNDAAFSAPLGNPFFPEEDVRLTFRHNGPSEAQLVVFRDGMPIDEIRLEPGAEIQRQYKVLDLVDPRGEAQIVAADCAAEGCGATQSRLLAEEHGQSDAIYPIGDSADLHAAAGEELNLVLKFELYERKTQ